MRKAVIEVGKYTVKEGPTGGWSVRVTGAEERLSVHDRGDVHSASFPPERAPEIAEAILKAGRAAKRGKRSEKILAIRNED